jgi:hypothetical protein
MSFGSLSDEANFETIAYMLREIEGALAKNYNARVGAMISRVYEETVLSRRRCEDYICVWSESAHCLLVRC